MTVSVYNHLTSAQITASANPLGDCPTHCGVRELTDLGKLTGDSGDWETDGRTGVTADKVTV